MQSTWMLIIVIISFLSSACVGPSTPFGPLSYFLPNKSEESLEQKDHSQVKVYFSPDKQVWHKSQDVSITIEDERGIVDGYKIKFLYNKQDITDGFLSSTKKVFNKNHKKLTFALSSLRLLPQKNNEVQFIYYNQAEQDPVIVNYESPQCSLFQQRNISSVSPFKTEDDLLATIAQLSKSEGFNPAVVAAIIANQSGFNKSLVTSKKALGITQVPLWAETYALAGRKDWPRYPDIEKISYIWLKVMVLFGSISAHNEWRLDEEFSIRGSISYINYLYQYWKKKENFVLQQRSPASDDQVILDLILASYSHPQTEIKKSLDAYGETWLESEEMKEIRREVGRIKSFCYHFESEDIAK